MIMLPYLHDGYDQPRVQHAPADPRYERKKKIGRVVPEWVRYQVGSCIIMNICVTMNLRLISM